MAAGDAVISPGLTRKLIDTFGDRLPRHSPGQQKQLADLTGREREVLTAIASGWTNAEIAERLHLAESTVKSHISRIPHQDRRPGPRPGRDLRLRHRTRTTGMNRPAPLAPRTSTAFRPYAAGHVTWNGADFAGLDPDQVWQRCGPVPQKFAERPLRVRENVTLGQPRTRDDTLVRQALDAVGMREPVEGLPHRLDTLPARELFGGTELSGGQWQRLVCSRALYRRPDLLILDEPTSQMDARGEHAILELADAEGVFAGLLTLSQDR